VSAIPPPRQGGNEFKYPTADLQAARELDPPQERLWVFQKSPRQRHARRIV